MVGKRHKIWRFDKPLQTSVLSHVQSVAFQTKLYDFEALNGTTLSLENFLSKIEGDFCKSLLSVCSNPSPLNLLNHKVNMAYFVSLQLVRTPSLWRVMRDIEATTKELLKDDAIELPELKENDIKRLQAIQIIDYTPYYADILLNLKWILIQNEFSYKYPFWISDNPVFRFRGKGDDKAPGLLDRGVEIYMPLNPQFVLLICDPDLYFDVGPKLLVGPEFIRFFNSQQVVHSLRSIFSPLDDFKLARELLKAEPELSDPNRQRAHFNNTSYNREKLLVEIKKSFSKD